MPQSIGSQRVGHDLVTEQQQEERKKNYTFYNTFIAKKLATVRDILIFRNAKI